MLRPFLAVLIIFGATATLHAEDEKVDIEYDFRRLDSVVARYDEYVAQKERSIEEYKRRHLTVSAPIDQYNIYKYIVGEYSKFNPDSAIYYARLCEEIAQDNGYSDLFMSAHIDEMTMMLLRGDYMGVQYKVGYLRPIDEYSSSLQPNLAILLMELNMRMRSIEPTIHAVDFAKPVYPDAWDTYGKYIPAYSWRAAYYRTLLRGDVDKEQLRSLIDTSPMPSVRRAMLCFALAKAYAYDGDEERSLHYLIISAINDIKMANREASSLIYILHSDLLDKASKRAANYVMVCTENVKSYGDRGRSLDVVLANSTITRSYEERLVRQSDTLKGMVALLVLLVVVIALMMWSLRKKNRRQREANEKLLQLSTSLRQRIEGEEQVRNDLKESNEQLTREIKQRNRNFMESYMMITSYIDDTRKYVRLIYNLITAGKVEKARKELLVLGSSEKHMQEFFKQFDRAFLTAHPDFIERFNRLLRPECAVTVTGMSLTPELRIYALVSIGITDSVTIAKFLHYSPQTIYNYRLRMRRGAGIPEKDFADAVARMYE